MRIEYHDVRTLGEAKTERTLIVESEDVRDGAGEPWIVAWQFAVQVLAGDDPLDDPLDEA